MRRPLSLLIAAAIVAAWPGRAALAQDFNAVWVVGPNDVWAAGSSGLVMHGVNGAWTTVPARSSDDLRDIWGSGPRDLWIVGEGGTILRWNGTALARMPSPISTDFIAVHGCSAADVWLVGQSEDQSQPPPLLHWNGTALTVERLPVAFRAADIVGVCVAGAGSGGGLTIVGTTFFDPRPTERRYVGVVVRRQGAAWTSLCWDGRRVTDDQLCGTAWTGVAAGGGVTLLRGGDQGETLLLSGRTGWSRLPAPPGEYETALVTADGSPVLIMEDGWARLTGGQWRRIGGGTTSVSGGIDQAEMARITTRLSALAQKMQTGQMTAAEQQEWLQLQTRVMQMSTGVTAQVQVATAEAQRAASRAFGRDPGVFPAATGSDFYVASGAGTIFHVSGDNSRIVHSVPCATNPALCR